MLCYIDLSCTSETTVALGELVAISRWVGLSPSWIGKRRDGVWRRGVHWTKRIRTSEHSCFRNPFSQHPVAALNVLQGLSLERSDPKVQLGIAPPLVAWACFEINCQGMPGIRASVFYSVYVTTFTLLAQNSTVGSMHVCVVWLYYVCS